VIQARRSKAADSVGAGGEEALMTRHHMQVQISMSKRLP
jgi:hypothetical protein